MALAPVLVRGHASNQVGYYAPKLGAGVHSSSSCFSKIVRLHKASILPYFPAKQSNSFGIHCSLLVWPPVLMGSMRKEVAGELVL